MIAELKRTWKLMRYSYNFKITIVCSIAVLLMVLLMNGLALISEAIAVKGFMMAGLFFFLAVAMGIQNKDNLVFSSLVLSSRRRRFLEICFTDIYCVIGSILSYVLECICIFFFVKDAAIAEVGISVATLFILTAMSIAVFTIFYGFYNKFYFLAFFLCFLMYFVIDICSELPFINELGSMVNHSKGMALLLGILIITVASGIAMILRRVFYKRTTSKYSGSVGLRKGMA